VKPPREHDLREPRREALQHRFDYRMGRAYAPIRSQRQEGSKGDRL
jgi:hypothetical protein